jgi:hypothetical protein
VVWLWVGGGIMALGTLVALSPSLRRRERPTPEAAEETVPVEPAVREREEALT